MIVSTRFPRSTDLCSAGDHMDDWQRGKYLKAKRLASQRKMWFANIYPIWMQPTFTFIATLHPLHLRIATSPSWCPGRVETCRAIPTDVKMPTEMHYATGDDYRWLLFICLSSIFLLFLLSVPLSMTLPRTLAQRPRRDDWSTLLLWLNLCTHFSKTYVRVHIVARPNTMHKQRHDMARHGTRCG